MTIKDHYCLPFDKPVRHPEITCVNCKYDHCKFSGYYNVPKPEATTQTHIIEKERE